MTVCVCVCVWSTALMLLFGYVRFCDRWKRKFPLNLVNREYNQCLVPKWCTHLISNQDGKWATKNDCTSESEREWENEKTIMVLRHSRAKGFLVANTTKCKKWLHKYCILKHPHKVNDTIQISECIKLKWRRRRREWQTKATKPTLHHLHHQK